MQIGGDTLHHVLHIGRSSRFSSSDDTAVALRDLATFSGVNTIFDGCAHYSNLTLNVPKCVVSPLFLPGHFEAACAECHGLESDLEGVKLRPEGYFHGLDAPLNNSLPLSHGTGC